MIKLKNEYSISKELTGLVATKIANEYQKPTLILNETYDGEKNLVWSGSGRIFSQSNFTFFRRFLDESSYFEFAQGHEGAFGCAIKDVNVRPFIAYANKELADFDFTPKYYIDLAYDALNLTGEDILNLANYDYLWGQGVEEPVVLVDNIKILKENIALLKGTTLKITLPSGINMIKFGSSEEEFKALKSGEGCITIKVIGHFQRNVWNGNVSPQILIEDYEIKRKMSYYF